MWSRRWTRSRPQVPRLARRNEPPMYCTKLYTVPGHAKGRRRWLLPKLVACVDHSIQPHIMCFSLICLLIA